MAKRKDPSDAADRVICGIRQQNALSAMLHWLKGVSRVEIRPQGNVFHGKVSMHIEFKTNRHQGEFMGIIESMPCIVLKKRGLMQADIEVGLKKLAEETA